MVMYVVGVGVCVNNILISVCACLCDPCVPPGGGGVLKCGSSAGRWEGVKKLRTCECVSSALSGRLSGLGVSLDMWETIDYVCYNYVIAPWEATGNKLGSPVSELRVVRLCGPVKRLRKGSTSTRHSLISLSFNNASPACYGVLLVVRFTWTAIAQAESLSCIWWAHAWTLYPYSSKIAGRQTLTHFGRLIGTSPLREAALLNKIYLATPRET